MLTPQEINAKMASIMGWHKDQCNCGSCNVWYWVDDNGTQIMYGPDWNPWEITDHTFMVLHKWLEDSSERTCDISFGYSRVDTKREWHCFLLGIKLSILRFGDTQSQAICNCLLKTLKK
ncbi:MAG: hypothetical protein A2Y66_01690 [Nitrospirae bacterium RBG_13_41_22]|nr:MAG: hypothetical protein A2Y66_01690 [Nitrospirae bacterium RBG_13_41_22]